MPVNRAFATEEVADLRKLDNLTWQIICLVAAIVLLCSITTDFRIAWASFFPAMSASAALVAGSWYYGTKRNEPRLSSALTCTAQIAVFAAVGASLSYLAASVGLPLQDDVFDAFDKALGFDWMTLFAWLNTYPKIFGILGVFYYSMTVQAALLVLCLAFTGRLIWLRVFILAFVFATITTIAIATIVPAQGVWIRYGLQAIEHSAIVPTTKTFWPVFEGLRNGTYRELVAAGAEGIITFPSLHAALAVILAVAMWPIPGLRWLGAAANIAMLIATPIEGLHYLTDILAGTAIGTLAVVASYTVARCTLADSLLGVANGGVVPAE